MYTVMIHFDGRYFMLGELGLKVEGTTFQEKKATLTEKTLNRSQFRTSHNER